MSAILQIENEVPFGRTLFRWLYLRGLHLDKLVRHDDMEKRYLAWETVRKQSNPFFQKGTGFEGYLIGQCTSAEAALEAILAINQNILDSIARLYRFEYGFRSRLFKTLTKEAGDPAAIHIWSAYLGAELGKLRMQTFNNAEARRFRSRTYAVVQSLPPMVYHEIEGDVTQRYAVGKVDASTANKLAVTWQALKPGQQEAWQVAENIGEFGHPLVRKMLDHA